MFRIVSRNEFSLKIFEEYPVWSEHYDYDEIEEIVRWGIDRKWLLSEIKEKHTGNDHCFYPVLQINPFPKITGLLYIKAIFTTEQSFKFFGYIVSEDAYAIGIFINNEDVVFNRYLKDLSNSGKEKLQKTVGNRNDKIFPLYYETEFLSKTGDPIKGVFDFSKR